MKSMKTLHAIGVALAMIAGAGQAATAEAVKPFKTESLAQIEEAHRGKPFIVVMWSLDCAYCGPTFAALAKARHRHRIAVETVATDPIEDEDILASVRHKLGGARLNGNAWAFVGAAAPEQLRYAVDPKWRGELPRTYWYDANGKRTAYSGLVSDAMVKRFLTSQSPLPKAARDSR
jgi:hypothetical protein